jgi:hypothetical protein
MSNRASTIHNGIKSCYFKKPYYRTPIL